MQNWRHDKYDKIMEILDRLQNYTREHFSDEEEYMKEKKEKREQAEKLKSKY